MVALASFLLILLASVAAFGYSLAGPFQFDDYSLLTDAAVHSPAGWLAVWAALRTRPVTYLSFWLNFLLGGENPFGYHAVNLVLHVACATLLWKVLGRLVPARAALLGALLFAVHPIQAEPVAYIFARSTLLMTLFCLLSMSAWLEERPWGALAFFGLALASKEECAAFPVVLVILHVARKRPRQEWRAILAMMTLSLAAGLHLLMITRLVAGSGAGFGSPLRPLQYLAAQGGVLWRYARLLLIPYGMTIDPDIRPGSAWIGAAGWLVIGALILLLLKSSRMRAAGLWVLAAVVLLLPSSSLIPVNDLAADRRLYLPMAALCGVAGTLLTRIPRGALVALFALWIALSIGRMRVWSSEESLWTEAVERSPEKLRPRLQLARVADSATAIDALDAARRVAPQDPRVAAESGSWYLRHGRPDLALREFGRALALDPRSPLALNNRGAALAALHQDAAARLDFEKALKLDPCLTGARENLRRLGVANETPASCPAVP